MEVHYRWHALYGRKVRQLYAEQRSGREVVVVEAEPGVAIVLAAWMLDPAVCSTMSLGAPTINIAGLADLDRLLKARGLRRRCSDEPLPTEEVHHATVAIDCSDQTTASAPISLDRPVLNGMTPTDRNTAIRRLARLLMEAAGVDPEEIGNDEC